MDSSLFFVFRSKDIVQAYMEIFTILEKVLLTILLENKKMKIKSQDYH
jgi:hypothetical protein